MQSLQIENLLQALESEGELDSSGRFTLDISQAAPKLAEFQLRDPFQYILKLVQAAARAGADKFDLRSGATEVQCTMWGVSFPAESLSNLLYYLLQEDQSGVDPALKHLAMGVNAAVGTRASEIVLRSWDGSRGTEVRWTRERNSVAEWKPQRAEKQTVFYMRRLIGDMFSELYQKVAARDVVGMLRGDRQAMDREQGLVYDTCAFSPMLITINGNAAPGYELGSAPYARGFFSWLNRMISPERGLDPKFHLFEAYTAASDESGLAPPSVSHAGYKLDWQGSVVYQRILALPCGFPQQRNIRVVPVQDGVMLPPLRLAWDGPAGIFYVSADEFGKDLTSLQLIRNERLERQLNGLAEDFLVAAERYLGSKPARKTPLHLREALQKAVCRGRRDSVRLIG